MTHDPCQWLPFALLPSAPEAGRPDPEILELRAPAEGWHAGFTRETVDTVQAWPVDAVLKNFALRAAVWQVRAGERTAPRSTLADLRAWLAQTRSLADRLPVGGPLRDRMVQAADQMDADLSWPSRFFTRHPTSIFTKADADWRVSLNLWAADRLLRAVNASEPDYAAIRGAETGTPTEHLHVPPTAFWTAMFDWCPAERLDPPFKDYIQAQNRVTRFNATIKPGLSDPLMVDLLRDVLRTGHFGPPDTLA